MPWLGLYNPNVPVYDDRWKPLFAYDPIYEGWYYEPGGITGPFYNFELLDIPMDVFDFMDLIGNADLFSLFMGRSY